MARNLVLPLLVPALRAVLVASLVLCLPVWQDIEPPLPPDPQIVEDSLEEEGPEGRA